MLQKGHLIVTQYHGNMHVIYQRYKEGSPMANVNITIRMDEDLKKQADALFDELGMSFTTAINVFVRQAIREGRIPFEVTTVPTAHYSTVEM